MTEDYLHYIFKHRLFSQENLKTTDGQTIYIKNIGIHNANAGPDFLEARVQIDGHDWAGHVELHIRSSDWARHNHHTDAAYNNVVLHVVYQHDAEALRQSGTTLPTLVIQGLFDEMGYWQFEQFVSGKKYLACENLLKDVDPIHIHAMQDRALIDRLEQKTAFVHTIYEATNQNWDETCYRLLLYTFGLKVNADALLTLAERLPLHILRKHTGNLQQIEALLFGTAGLLQNQDDYATALGKEFNFLQLKYDLHPLQRGHLKFARLRPPGFPTVRLAQLAAIINQKTQFFRNLLDAENISNVMALFAETPSQYWHSHYNFGKPSREISKAPATSLIHLVAINALVPLVFAYAKKTDNPDLEQRALAWLAALPPEENSITKYFTNAGVHIENAHQSQAVLQLYKYFCLPRKCLSCGIGIHILKQK